jgi:type II secretion system protein N
LSGPLNFINDIVIETRRTKDKMASGIKNKKWLGYTLYVALITVLLLYYLFPAQAVEEFIDNTVSRANQEFAFKAEKIGPWIPVGLQITAGEIYLSSIPEPVVFKADSLFVRPQILKLVKGEYSFDLDGKAYKGDIKGTLHLTGENKDIAGKIIFNDLALADYSFLAEKYKHRMIGNLSGEIVYGNKSAGATGGRGKVVLRLTGGQLQFQAPILNITSVDLQSIKMEAELRRGEITIIKAELAGSEVNGSMTGSIQLQKDIGLSQINLKGTLEPLAEFYKNYPGIRELLKTMKKRVKRGQYFFAVTGTLGDPKFKLL